MALAQRANADNSGLARVPALDGWRGISILLVLVGHMLPLGPKWLQLNGMVSAAGLSIFFFLSGFLVVSMLLRNDNVASFFVRRLFRILPLAWLVLLAMLALQTPSIDVWLANLLFYANIFPDGLLPKGEHLWSLSLEVQFYLAIGLIVSLLGRRGLWAVPIACLMVTGARAFYGIEFSILTWFRIDEILAGGTVALLLNSPRFARLSPPWPLFFSLLLALALFASCHYSFGFLNYLRPYITALLIYTTLFTTSDLLRNILESRLLKYCASTSYALYVIHPLTYAGWLGEGDVAVKYSKRILSFALTFAFAHVSTRYYERYWNELGHKLALRVERPKEFRGVAFGPNQS